MNEEKFNYLGITKWHNKGYYGKGITIASRESLSPHGKKVFDVITQICPEANRLYKQEFHKTISDGIDIYTTSMFSSSDKYPKYIDKSKAMYDSGIFLCCAVGNYDDEKQTSLSKLKWWTSIGACYYYPKTNIVKKAEYSSLSEDLDFMSITNMQTNTGIFTGTSCATPVFASMLVLVQQFFKEKCGRKLTNTELLKFIRDNTMDIGENGFDVKTGYGIFILPPPETINVKDYINMDKIIELNIGSKKARVDNKEIELDVEPIIKDGRTLVPIRFIAESLGCEVFWDNGKVIIQKG